MENKMLDMIVNFGLGKFCDNYGYNVLEMDYDDYVANIDKVGAFLLATENYLRVTTVDEYGNPVTNKEDLTDTCHVIIYDINVWKENGLI